ncbi:MAG: T9SS type A sorting domain-containing protein [Flavobacterium sp.]|nr:T9SS type A sorting domain-containing protein [Flavobacterium sp.]
MRVTMKYNASPTSCETFTYGQVEDYTVNITSSGRDDEGSITSIKEINIYPNPAVSILNLTSVSEKATYNVYSLVGQMVLQGRISNSSIDVSALPSGNYLIEIYDEENITRKQFIKQ